MKIVSVKAVCAEGGWYVDDKPAFIAGAEVDHYLVTGRPVTAGFRRVREPGEVVAVLMRLDDGTTVVGEGGSVTYAGIAGRDPVLRAEAAVATVAEHIAGALTGRAAEDFRALEATLKQLSADCGPFHSGVLYATSQALLQAVAAAAHRPPAVVIAEEYGLSIAAADPKLGIQTGDERYSGVDKAIYRRVDVLPHGLIKKVGTDFGAGGEKLLAYAAWIKGRLAQHQTPPDYLPTIHFDCYGTIGRAFANDPAAIRDYLGRLAGVVAPLQLQVEAPVEAAGQGEQIELMAQLRAALQELPAPVPAIIADEWCNSLADVELFAKSGAADLIQIKMPDLGCLGDSIAAVLTCHEYGVGAYLGGSCNETDISARTAVHVAVATGAEQILARPGMGIDEAVSIMRNELARLRAVL